MGIYRDTELTKGYIKVEKGYTGFWAPARGFRVQGTRFRVRVPLRYIEYWVYGDLITIYPMPYSIDLRGTVRGLRLLLGVWVEGYGRLEICKKQPLVG